MFTHPQSAVVPKALAREALLHSYWFHAFLGTVVLPVILMN